MASLNGTGQVTLLNESKASYTGITLYKDSLYISDDTRRSVFLTISATIITGAQLDVVVSISLTMFYRYQYTVKPYNNLSLQ